MKTMPDFPKVRRAILPDGPPEAYKTYRMVSPPSHRRRATCEEVECERWQKGWTTYLDVSDPQHAEAANWIRMKSGRKFTFTEEGTGVKFFFPAGQQCFGKHTIPFKPHILLVQGGDFRGNPLGTPTRRHVRMDDWVEDFAENQIEVRERIKRERG